MKKLIVAAILVASSIAALADLGTPTRPGNDHWPRSPYLDMGSFMQLSEDYKTIYVAGFVDAKMRSCIPAGVSAEEVKSILNKRYTASMAAWPTANFQLLLMAHYRCN